MKLIKREAKEIQYTIEVNEKELWELHYALYDRVSILRHNDAINISEDIAFTDKLDNEVVKMLPVPSNKQPQL